MVDVSGKDTTIRIATAKGRIAMRAETLSLIMEGKLPKGDVLAVARIAGVMGAKHTPDLIPMCHPLMLSRVSVDFEPDKVRHGIEVTATAKVEGKTGVEMEALTAVSVACLTIYDMCKSVDKAMRITDIRLVEKSGGKSGHYQAE